MIDCRTFLSSASLLFFLWIALSRSLPVGIPQKLIWSRGERGRGKRVLFLKIFICQYKMCVKCWNLLYFIKVLFFDILNSVYMTWIPNVAYSCAIKLSQEPIFSPKLLGNKPTFHEKPRFLACTEQNVRCSGHKIFIDQNWNKLVEGTHGGPPLSDVGAMW